MHDGILTAMNDVVLPRVEMAVRLITGLSGKGPNSIVQKPDRRKNTGNNENTSLRSASSQLVLIIEKEEIDETCDIDNSKDGDFQVTKNLIMTGERTLITVYNKHLDEKQKSVQVFNLRQKFGF